MTFKYEVIEDKHVITSEDVSGLLIVRRDIHAAFRDIAVALAMFEESLK